MSAPEMPLALSNILDTLTQMIDHQISHEIDIGAEEYWDKLFFNKQYNEALFIDRLKFDLWKLESQEEDDDELRRVVYAVPPMPDLPGPLKRVIKDGLGYHEHGVFNKKSRIYTVNVTPASMPSKLTITGQTHTQARGEGRCVRIHQAQIEARVFGIGGMLEKRMLDDMEKSYGKAANFTNTWLKTNSA